MRGVVPLSPGHARDLYGHGEVASVFGHLRQGVLVVDVDLPGTDGDLVVGQVEKWACTRRVAHLIRPSGGETGRAHIFLVVGKRDAEVRALVRTILRDLRDQERTKPRAERRPIPSALVEVKTAVRLLGAPHRSTGLCPLPYGGRSAQEKFLDALEMLPSKEARAGKKKSRRSERPPEPYALTTRTKRLPLPEQFRQYLDGTGPRPVVGEDSSQSAVEAHLVAALVRTGMTRDQARGEVIRHAKLLPRVAGDEGRFDKLWNRQVDHDEIFRRTIALFRAGFDAEAAYHRFTIETPRLLDHGDRSDKAVFVDLYEDIVEAYTRHIGVRRRPEPDLQQVDPGLHAAYEHLLSELLWAVPVAQRPSRFEVASWLLDRAQREGRHRVPCPERDLEVDCGLDRKTIRAALKHLDDIGFGTRCASFAPDGTGTASHEFEIVISHQGVRSTPPPCFHRPRGLHLPSRHLLLWHLLQPQPLPLQDQVLALLHSPTSSGTATTSQLRSLRSAAARLGRNGLSTCDSHGSWTATATPTNGAVQLHEQERLERLEKVRRERAVYATSCPSAAFKQAQREAVRACRQRSRRWWRSLNASERTQRRQDRRAHFAALPFQQQRLWVARWDRRDAIAGLPSPAERHSRWLSRRAHDPDFEDECARRAHEFSQLSPTEQARRAHTWQAYRLEHGLPDPSTRREQRALPDATDERTNAFLEHEAARLPLDVVAAG